jgi:hypothetical protein
MATSKRKPRAAVPQPANDEQPQQPPISRPAVEEQAERTTAAQSAIDEQPQHPPISQPATGAQAHVTAQSLANERAMLMRRRLMLGLPVLALMLLAGGIGTLAVVALWTQLFPSLRRIDRLTEVDPASRA